MDNVIESFVLKFKDQNTDAAVAWDDGEPIVEWTGLELPEDLEEAIQRRVAGYLRATRQSVEGLVVEVDEERLWIHATAPTYHLYTRRSNGKGRVRLTVTPVTRAEADTLFSKLNPRTQVMPYSVAALPTDTTIPEDEV